MYDLPVYIEVHGKKYNIRNRGDYRMVLDCFQALRDVEMGENEKVLASLLIFYNEFNDYSDLPRDEEVLTELVLKMFKFFNCGEEESPGAQSDFTVIDWEQDEKILVSAINNVAKQEIRLTEYLHWWTFMSYFMAIGESLMSTVISIRSKIAKHEKLEKWEEKFRKDNPTYFVWKNTDLRAQEARAAIDEIWNVGR